MEPSAKSLLLCQLEENVNKHLLIVKDEISLHSPVCLERASPTGGWSVAQCLEHLNSYSRFYIPEIEKHLSKSASAPLQEHLSSSWIGNFFVTLVEQSASTQKYKAFKKHTPAPVLDSTAVVQEFIRHQEALLMCLHKAKTTDTRRKGVPFSMSSLIKLSIGDVLRFLVSHDARHIQQALRNLNPASP